jgi:xanthine dehydrogenase accessory factor
LVIFERLAAALRAARPVALVTRLDGAFAGAKLLVFADESFGDLGSAGLTYAATGEARALLAAGETSQRTFGEDGEPVGMDVRLFIQAFATKPDMYIFGATKARLPDADRVVVAWPDEFLRGAPVDDRTALIVLTHDVKFDIPLLEVALRTNAGYIGAMGSRRTHANRVAELRRSGTSDADLARINAPIGLQLGARPPPSRPSASPAEIIALREHRRGGRLSENGLPVHNERGRAHAATESS